MNSWQQLLGFSKRTCSLAKKGCLNTAIKTTFFAKPYFALKTQKDHMKNSLQIKTALPIRHLLLSFVAFRTLQPKKTGSDFGCCLTICQIVFEKFSHFRPIFHLTIYVLGFLEIKKAKSEHYCSCSTSYQLTFLNQNNLLSIK